MYVFHPARYTSKTVQICDVIYKNKALCTTKIAGTECVESFLASSIPGRNFKKSHTHTHKQNNNNKKDDQTAEPPRKITLFQGVLSKL